MPTQKQLDHIIEQINNMDSDELLSLNNQYCQDNSYSDDEFYNNDEVFFETFFANDVMSLVRTLSYSDYNFHHDYVRFNGNGNLESFECISADDLVYDVNTIAGYVLENESDYDNMFDFLEDEEEDEEEEDEEE